MTDADVEPEPCRDCRTPIPPNWGWCQECDATQRDALHTEDVEPEDLLF